MAEKVVGGKSGDEGGDEQRRKENEACEEEGVGRARSVQVVNDAENASVLACDNLANRATTSAAGSDVRHGCVGKITNTTSGTGDAYAEICVFAEEEYVGVETAKFDEYMTRDDHIASANDLHVGICSMVPFKDIQRMAIADLDKDLVEHGGEKKGVKDCRRSASAISGNGAVGFEDGYSNATIVWIGIKECQAFRNWAIDVSESVGIQDE